VALVHLDDVVVGEHERVRLVDVARSARTLVNVLKGDIDQERARERFKPRPGKPPST
jgi:hypothetical protein